MLINNNGINSSNLGSSNKLQENTGNTEKASNTPDSADSVNLSADAHSLSRLENAVANASDVDTSRIEAIRNAIDDGSYTIDAQAIATGLIASDDLS